MIVNIKMGNLFILGVKDICITSDKSGKYIVVNLILWSISRIASDKLAKCLISKSSTLSNRFLSERCFIVVFISRNCDNLTANIENSCSHFSSFHSSEKKHYHSSLFSNSSFLVMNGNDRRYLLPAEERIFSMLIRYFKTADFFYDIFQLFQFFIFYVVHRNTQCFFHFLSEYIEFRQIPFGETGFTITAINLLLVTERIEFPLFINASNSDCEANTFENHG